ncbi:hypothetical protein HID58_087328 [Brassica napus]|uniref:Uncharacterized protein n=1 Tax=Brassica napus TaxID=3708 RepID=A0ABQ7XT09_BRANA|nr:hypothetical protein HID58_087328 [Brassica napus]
MAVDEQNELPEATPREAELQRQLDGIQSQVTELNRARVEVTENRELSSEVQSLKEKLDKHSKQLEHSAENLSLLESENLTLRDENQALNMARYIVELEQVEERMYMWPHPLLSTNIRDHLYVQKKLMGFTKECKGYMTL